VALRPNPAVQPLEASVIRENHVPVGDLDSLRVSVVRIFETTS
jgi:hypothetical protein